MKKRYSLPLIALLLVLLLSACSGKVIESTTTPPAAADPTSTPEPTPTPAPEIRALGRVFTGEETELDVSEISPENLDEIIALAGKLPNLERIETVPENERSELLPQEEEPEPTPTPQAVVGPTPEPTPVPRVFYDHGEPIPPRLSQLDEAKIDSAAAEKAMAKSTNSLWQLEDLSRLRQGVDPAVEITCRFSLFGHTLSSADEEIIYFREDIGDEQLPLLRQAMPLLSSCRRLLLDDCNLTYEKLAEIREEFPERGLAWRVRFGIDSALTDAIRIWTISATDANCDVLKYCTEVLYIDVGENKRLSDFHFLDYMTKLRVVIVAHTWFDHIEFVTHCPDLEFLEADYCRIKDVSPLVGCKNLRDLSLENDLDLTDVSPLYEMTWLKRLRVNIVPNVPKEQLRELCARLTDTQIMGGESGVNRELWRWDGYGGKVEDYELLRAQIGYGIYLLPTDTLDIRYINSKGYRYDSIFTCS